MINKGLFITGTDTGAGKTVVTAGLLKLFRTNMIDAVPMKPVQTGCELKKNVLNAPDLDFSIRYSELKCSDDELELMSPYRYLPACSPHLAGKLSGVFPETEYIAACLKKLEARREFILVEGAGGIMVPLNEKEMMIDLIKAVNYPVVIVARTGLGTINHTLLSIEALCRSGITISGIIFNNVTPPDRETEYIREDNAKIISKLGKVKVLGIVDYIEGVQYNFAELENCFKNNFNIKMFNTQSINRNN